MEKHDTNELIHVPTQGNELLEQVLFNINNDEEIRTLWKVSNVNATVRLSMPDHGHVHFQIVANIGLRIGRILNKKGVEFSVTKDYGLSHKHGELIVLLACVFHDLGISVHRDSHEEFSLFLANNLLHRVLDFLPVNERTIVTSEVLHAIISHRRGGKPLSIEAGIVRVSDALDMSKGRSLIPYEAGILDIHSVSTAGIEGVEIKEGDERAVQINISMNNSAGLFQVDDLLKSKLKGSGIEKYVSVRAYIGAETEKKLLTEVAFKE